VRGLAIAALIAAAAPAAAAEAPQPTELERGVALFQAHRYGDAIPPLAAAHAADPADPDAALLLGIAYYQTGRPESARPLLEQAERGGGADAQASARVFLGLIADAAGDAERARGYYALVARSPTDLGASGRRLLDRDRPEWSIAAILRPGVDSNVPLLPTTAVGPGPGRGGGGQADADLTLIASATARPLGSVPLVLDETASYRKQVSLGDYDALGDVLGATVALEGGANAGSLAYHFELSTLGGARYELGHIADAGYRRALGGRDGLGLGLRYTFAARDFAQDAYAGYTGLYHTAIAEASWGGPAAPREFAIGYVLARDATDDATLAATGHGGRIAARLRPWAGAELRAQLTAGAYLYNEAARRDLRVRGEATLFIDVSHAVGIVLGATALHNASNAADADYDKWTAFGGLVVAASS
jgi:tetratricopeptide (TPR) repeat protein